MLFLQNDLKSKGKLNETRKIKDWEPSQEVIPLLVNEGIIEINNDGHLKC